MVQRNLVTLEKLEDASHKETIPPKRGLGYSAPTRSPNDTMQTNRTIGHAFGKPEALKIKESPQLRSSLNWELGGTPVYTTIGYGKARFGTSRLPSTIPEHKYLLTCEASTMNIYSPTSKFYTT
ncbi:hypothetical protein L3X38_033488 [Prunus dulcis]|uniref:Uncharacterized protein n=1 Tax=Prunus dulcis TaxID=3755 RepID=A0AAD4YWY1_PRUDU|nr:hypothetical protein L3X38_033488 [Prunus dulcis]